MNNYTPGVHVLEGGVICVVGESHVPKDSKSVKKVIINGLYCSRCKEEGKTCIEHQARRSGVVLADCEIEEMKDQGITEWPGEDWYRKWNKKKDEENSKPMPQKK